MLKAAEKYPYFPGQEPTLPGHVEFLLEVFDELESLFLREKNVVLIAAWDVIWIF